MLLDHFHPPLSDRRDWHGFHHAWATYLSARLNEVLPEHWFAQPNVRYGIEVDVAAIDDRIAPIGAARSGAAVALPEWLRSGPTSSIVLPAVVDEVEVQIFDAFGGRRLAGAVELVSPANKDRPDSRDAFTTKCLSLLEFGVGLLVVDVVTDRHANLHAELLTCRDLPLDAVSVGLYAASYRPLLGGEETTVDVWTEGLRIGAPLPTMPLFLRGGPCVRVELQETYDRTCREQRILQS